MPQDILYPIALPTQLTTKITFAFLWLGAIKIKLILSIGTYTKCNTIHKNERCAALIFESIFFL